MEVVIDPLGKRPAYAMHAGEVGYPCLPDALQSTELPEQGASALGAQTFD
jgi:hypothetical protein